MKKLKSWVNLRQEIVLDNKWLRVYENDYLLPNGKRLEKFYTVSEHPGVGIVAITKDNQVLITRQYRPSIDDFVYDFPSGFKENSDDQTLDRAKKELLEETGYVSDQWIYLGHFNPVPQRSNKTDYCYLALNASKKSEQNLDEDEDIDFELVSIKKLKKMIQSGELFCGTCIATFYKAILFIEENLKEYKI